MKKITAVIGTFLLLAAVLGSISAEGAQDWAILGERSLPDEKARELSMDVIESIEQGVVIAYIDWDKAPWVMRYDATKKQWDYIGEKAITDGKAEELNVAYFTSNQNKIYYMAYKDLSNDKKATIMMCDKQENKWVPFGKKGFTPHEVDGLVMFIDNIYPRIGYINTRGDKKPVILEYMNDEWVELKSGESDATSDDKAYLLDYTAVRGVPYIAYSDNKQKLKATVMYFDSRWTPLGNKGFSDGRVNYLSIAGQYSRQSKRERIIVAFQDYEHDKKLTVMYNENKSGEWLALGEKGFTQGSPDSIDIAVYKMVPFVAFADKANGYGATVMYYFKDKWHTLGTPGFSKTGVTDIQIRIHNDVAYIGYITTDSKKRFFVQTINVAEYLK